MKFKWVAACLLLAPAWAAGEGPASSTRPPSPWAGPIHLVIYHTNDIHGWIMPRPAENSAGKSSGLVGGMAALAGVVRAEKEPHLLLDAGDWSQGTPEGSLTKGGAVADAFNLLGYDAVEIGNHDFDYGEKSLQELAGTLKMPVLGANIYRSAGHARVPYVTPHFIKEVQGIKVGIFGLLTSRMSQVAFPEHIAGLDFRREIDEAEDQVRELRAHGAQVVIAVTHVGFDEPGKASFEGDLFLASHVPGIDLIVGGHSHTLLERGARDPVHGVLIVQTGKYLTRVGRVVLDVDPTSKKVVGSSAQVIELDAGNPGSSPDVAALVDRYRAEVGRDLDVVVATAAVRLRQNTSRESALGDWMSDCFSASSHAQISFQNALGIRSDLPAGPITLRRLFEIMPFDNHLVTMKLTGRQIREVLEQGAGGRVGLIQVAGLEFHYRPQAEAGHRVVAVSVAGSPLRDDGIYSAATSDFLRSGGDGYKTFEQGTELARSPKLLRDILSECAREQGTVRDVPLNRAIEEK